MYKNVKLITFDAMNTLFTTKLPPGMSYYHAAKKMFPHLKEETEEISLCVTNNFKEVYKIYYGEYTLNGQSKETCKMFWEGVIGKTLYKSGVDLTEIEMKNVTDQLYGEYSTSKYWKPFNETHKVLDKLHAKGTRLGIVSNFDERLENVLKSLDLMKYMEFVIFPPVTKGLGKPNPRVFQQLLKEYANCKPEEIVHIGDDKENDFIAAKKAGIKPLLLDKFNTQSDPNYITMTSLNDIFKFVDFDF